MGETREYLKPAFSIVGSPCVTQFSSSEICDKPQLKRLEVSTNVFRKKSASFKTRHYLPN